MTGGTWAFALFSSNACLLLLSHPVFRSFQGWNWKFVWARINCPSGLAAGVPSRPS